MRLTAKKCEREKRPGRYPDGHGLYLQVRGPQNRSFLFRYERNGKDTWFGLGPTHTVTLKEARERARAARLLLLDGIDPLAHRRAERAKLQAAKAKQITFKEAAEAAFAQREAAWRNRKHAAQWITTLRQFAFPLIGGLPVETIDTPLVLKVLEQHVEADQRGLPAGPLWKVRTETASRLRGRIEAVLGWCTVRGLRSGDNPARWRGHLSEVLPARGQIAKSVHHPAMPYRDLPGFVEALCQREGVAPKALLFLVLTAARAGEVLNAKWSEIDFENKLWVIPPDRMKRYREHRVPLPDRAIEVLRSTPVEEGNDRIFIGSRGPSLSHTALLAALRRMGRRTESVHGFRSSFSTWASESTHFPHDIVEQALAHVTGNAVERAYRRGDVLTKRRALMDAWAQYCMTPPSAEGTTVVPLRKVDHHA